MIFMASLFASAAAACPNRCLLVVVNQECERKLLDETNRIAVGFTLLA